MATARKYGTDGKDLGTVELPAALFDGDVNEHLIWEAVHIYLQNRRQGTAATKNRSAVSGGGRKPWKQKGTGRARAGSNTSPLWPGGGVAFGPQPRHYSARMNQKAKKSALIGALTVRAREGGVVVVAPPALSEPKTKQVADYLKSIGLAERKVLWVTDKSGVALLKSTRNLARVDTAESGSLHPYSLMNCETLILTEDGLKSLSDRLGSGEANGEHAEERSKQRAEARSKRGAAARSVKSGGSRSKKSAGARSGRAKESR